MSFADYEVNVLTLADLSAAYTLELAAYPIPWPKSVFEQSLTNHYRRWALRRQGRLVGMAFFQVLKPEAELLNFAIDPMCQGQGLGLWLLKAVLQQLQLLGVTNCFLEVRASNLAAIKLYERLNFNQIGVRAGYYPGLKRGREDAYLYALDFCSIPIAPHGATGIWV